MICMEVSVPARPIVGQQGNGRPALRGRSAPGHSRVGRTRLLAAANGFATSATTDSVREGRRRLNRHLVLTVDGRIAIEKPGDGRRSCGIGPGDRDATVAQV